MLELQNATITLESIEEEIKECEHVLVEFRKKRDDVKNKYDYLTNRLAVLNALQDQLDEGSVRLINDANIKLIIDERFDLLPEIRRYIKTIENYESILEGLKTLKEKHKDC